MDAVKSANKRLSTIGLYVCYATWIMSSPLDAAEYFLFPDMMTGGRTKSKVVCTTPSGWEGWKEQPHYWDGVNAESRKMLESAHRVGVLFVQPGCRHGLNCPKLEVATIGADALGQPNISSALEYFVEGLKHQRCGDRNPAVVRFGSLQAGTLPIWRIDCESDDHHLATFILQRDVVVTIRLSAPNAKQIIDKLDSLKQLARSVRIVQD